MGRKRNRHTQEDSTSEDMEDRSLLQGQDTAGSPREPEPKPINLDERIDSILNGISRLKSNMDGAIKELEWLIRDMMESQADRRKTPPAQPKDGTDPPKEET